MNTTRRGHTAVEARFLNERHPVVDERNGPAEYGRVGFSIGPEVFWTGAYFSPGTSSESYDEADAFARKVVRCWNSHDELVSILNAVSITLAAHGKVDANTPLHARIDAALRKATEEPGT